MNNNPATEEKTFENQQNPVGEIPVQNSDAVTADKKSKKDKKQVVPKIIAFLVAFLVTSFIGYNYQNIKDLIAAASFQPDEKIVAIESKLNLTKKGTTIFRASAPSLDESEEFNVHCKTENSDSSTLGCFSNEHIYIYNVTAEEVDGIVESTAAHELLHARWARLKDEERNNFESLLKQLYENADDEFKESVDVYEEDEKLEEIYVRSATQIRELPEELEKHFAEIFVDQDKIVDFYEKYITPFNKLEEELEKLEDDLNKLGEMIDKNTADYESRAEKLSSDIDEFNACASRVGCFVSEGSFYSRRAALVAEDNALDALYETLNKDIDNYNSKVETYNSKLVYGEELNNKINSNPKVKEEL